MSEQKSTAVLMNTTATVMRGEIVNPLGDLPSALLERDARSILMGGSALPPSHPMGALTLKAGG